MHEHQPRGAFVLGPHCEHCDSRAACPAFTAEAVNLARSRYPYTPEDAGGMALTTAERSYLAGIIPAMRSALDRAEAAVRAGGPVLLADGREYGPALEEVTTFKTRETFDALAAVVGEDEANKAAEFTAAGIKRALEDAPRGAFSALMKDVEARGGLVRGTREVWRRRWPAKSVEVVSDGQNGVSQGCGSGGVHEREDGRPSDDTGGADGQGPDGPGVEPKRRHEGGATESEGHRSGTGRDGSGEGRGHDHGTVRATCSGCFGSFSVTKAGRMRKHLGPDGNVYCRDAVGMSPKPAAAPLPGLVEEARGLT